MKSPILRLLIPTLLALPGLRANNFEARIQLQTGEVQEVFIRPRRPGTTILEIQRRDREGWISTPVADIRRVHFELEGIIDPNAVEQDFFMGRHEEVLAALGGRVNPYFAFADMQANTNELIKFFFRSLYHTGRYNVVEQASGHLRRFTTRGEVAELASIFEILSRIKQGGEPEELAELAQRLPEPELLNPHAPAIWYAQAITALSTNDWRAAYPPLARIITEAPMATEWVGEALYLTATFHHNIATNLVVANQICQEVMIVAPGSPWATKAEARMLNIAEDAKELGVTLTDFGAFRDREREAGDAVIDYRERQRALREEAARQRLEAMQ